MHRLAGDLGMVAASVLKCFYGFNRFLWFKTLSLLLVLKTQDT